jgi:hypothetical protein
MPTLTEMFSNGRKILTVSATAIMKGHLTTYGHCDILTADGCNARQNLTRQGPCPALAGFFMDIDRAASSGPCSRFSVLRDEPHQ